MYDMTIRLRTDSDKCLYQQIYEHIRQEIREGKLLAGERLPSITLNISPTIYLSGLFERRYPPPFPRRLFKYPALLSCGIICSIYFTVISCLAALAVYIHRYH